MSKQKSNRSKYEVTEARYKVFYKGNRCYYCGSMADCMDHVPAISIAYEYGSDWVEKNGYHHLKVSSCTECNQWLGNKPLNSLGVRVKFIYDKIQTKYEGTLSHPLWEQDEIDLLEGQLFDYINMQGGVQNWVEGRLEYMEDLHYDLV